MRRSVRDALKGKRDPDQFPILTQTTPLQELVRGGPSKPQPFPDSGVMEKLINCPRCQHKRVPYWYAPYEAYYKTQCLDCGQLLVIHPEDYRREHLGTVLKQPSLLDVTGYDAERNIVHGDATAAFEHAREKHDLGVRKAHAQGLIPKMGEDD